MTLRSSACLRRPPRMYKPPRGEETMSAAGKRLVGVAVCAVVICVLIGLYIGLYLTTSPGDASAAGVTGSNGTNLYLATVAASELSDPHPSWVSYYVVDAKDQNWHHATTFELPANTLVHVTVYQFDGQSGLRNSFLSQATGIVGGTFELNGKPTQS